MRVVFSYARSEERLKRLAGEAQRNARAGTLREAAPGADAVSLAETCPATGGLDAGCRRTCRRTGEAQGYRRLNH